MNELLYWYIHIGSILLIAGIITERGIVPATPEGIASVARSAER